jgi:hypothetical protein
MPRNSDSNTKFKVKLRKYELMKLLLFSLLFKFQLSAFQTGKIYNKSHSTIVS